MPCPRSTPLRFLLALSLLLLATTGCSFDRKWRDLRRQALAGSPPAAASTTAPADPLAGRWEGRWTSDASGHSGKLRAIVTRAPGDATGNNATGAAYRVDYDAMFFGVLRAGYGTDLTATPHPDGATAFEGRQNLGPLAGGVYHYAGRADGATFTSTYKSPADHGRFEMVRPNR